MNMYTYMQLGELELYNAVYQGIQKEKFDTT